MNKLIGQSLTVICVLSALLLVGCGPKETDTIKSDDAPKGASTMGMQSTGQAGAQKQNSQKMVAPRAAPQ